MSYSNARKFGIRHRDVERKGYDYITVLEPNILGMERDGIPVTDREAKGLLEGIVSVTKREGAAVGLVGDKIGCAIYRLCPPAPMDRTSEYPIVLKTDGLVLIFDDVRFKFARGASGYVETAYSTDLCPNVKHVRLSDYR
jgi:hypothetical protein